MTATVDVLAIGSHPDDVELGCGATLAQLVDAGRRVGIVHLTQGELGTRGTVEGRRREAERAGAALGAAVVELLDCGDGRLRHGEEEEDALIAVLRRLRPELLLGPPPHDRHPDHGRSHALVRDAAFYAGLRRRAPGAGAPHRPAAIFSYMQNDAFTPSFIVDAAAGWSRKLAALAEYASQLHRPQFAGGEPAGEAAAAAATAATAGQDEREPMTKVSSPLFARAVEARARHFGLLIGVELGEPFCCATPLAVADPWLLRPTGLR